MKSGAGWVRATKAKRLSTAAVRHSQKSADQSLWVKRDLLCNSFVLPLPSSERLTGSELNSDASTRRLTRCSGRASRTAGTHAATGIWRLSDSIPRCGSAVGLEVSTLQARGAPSRSAVERERSRGRKEGSVGKRKKGTKTVKVESEGEGTRKWEKKEVFKDGLCFVVTEGDRPQSQSLTCWPSRRAWLRGLEALARGSRSKRREARHSTVRQTDFYCASPKEPQAQSMLVFWENTRFSHYSVLPSSSIEAEQLGSSLLPTTKN